MIKKLYADIILHIIDHIDQVKDLVNLANTCHYLRVCVIFKNTRWKHQYEIDFSLQDSSEQRWLYIISSSMNKIQWFTAYCKRRAIEYRWRHGKYQIHIPSEGHLSNGIRLQSIPSDPRSLEDFMIATQYLCDHGKTKWFIERPYWGNIPLKDAAINYVQYSNQYLFISITYPKLYGIGHHTPSDLYIWRWNQLDRQPQCMIKHVIGQFNHYHHWLTTQHIKDQQIYTQIYHLDHQQVKMIIHGGINALHIQSCTDNMIRVIWKDRKIGSARIREIDWRIWEYQTTYIEPKCLASGQVQLNHLVRNTELIRVNNERFMIAGMVYSDPTSLQDVLPNLIMMSIQKTNQVDIIWSIAIHASKFRPILSQQLLIAESRMGYQLLNLENGHQLYHITTPLLSCWSLSGLYPIRSQWEDLIKYEYWKNPIDDAKDERISINSITTYSCNAILYVTDGQPIIVDYTI
jgi:hypothetical protein